MMKQTITLILIAFAMIAKADSWTQKSNFPGGRRVELLSFSMGNKGYVGCGVDSALDCKNDFWEYDPSTDAWTQKADFGGAPRTGLRGFAIGNKGYAGLGYTGTSSFQDFWEYDPSTNAWTQKADFGGGIRYLTVGFSIGGKGFMGTGLSNLGISFNDLWEYDPATNVWTQKTSLPGQARRQSNCFVIGIYAYIVGGRATANLSDVWAYNSVSDTWSQKASFSTPRFDAVAFSICDKGYYGTGQGAGFFNDWWQYNPVTNSWIQKTDFAGGDRDEGAYFSIGTKGYFGLGGQTSASFKDFWEYTPDSLCATGIEELPSSDFKFSISPNPAKDFLIIDFPKNVKGKLNLTIMDARGKLILKTQTEANNNQTSFSVQDLSKGIYFVEANDGKQIALRKFIKE